MSLLSALSPQARQELLDLIDARIADALRRQEPKRRWVSVREASQVLGLSEKAIRGRAERGHIGVKRMGRSVLVDLASLDRELENGA